MAEPTVQKNFDLPIELAERLERVVFMGLADSQRSVAIAAIDNFLGALENLHRHDGSVIWVGNVTLGAHTLIVQTGIELREEGTNT